MHIGNVGDFNAQFADGSPDVRRAGGHYSCLAAFYSPEPRILVLPGQAHDFWTRELSRVLEWPDVEVYDEVAADDGGVARGLLSRTALLDRIRRSGLPVITWGRTPESERLLTRSGARDGTEGGPGEVSGAGPDGLGRALRVTRRYESKATAHRLFRTLAPAHPGIVVPAQERVASRRRAARALAARAAAGAAAVVKTEYGVGGSGTLVVTPRQVAEAGGARSLVGHLPRGPLLIEDYVEGDGSGSGPCRNLTFDAVVDGEGAVHPVGVGVMDIEGTGYQGVTVGPGVVPDAPAEVAERFASAVGRALAAEGYQGWYDVDFVMDGSGRLAPVEINVRLTGPAAAFVIQARLAGIQGGRPLVRTLDRLPLGARLPAAALADHLGEVSRRCRSLGVTLLPTVVTAVFEPDPYVGVALAARTPGALDAAEAVVRSANDALGRMFTDLGVSSGPRPGSRPGPRPGRRAGAGSRRTPRPRRRRS
ncbi:hypothetical protein [Streptomyces sparsogenes]|uniref:ATP-grasp domain-containing protein n=1 Tax=Streptomyces sparsogenes DSM 40356 TaxID=1331668 RepID=A0A1R1SD91_9ACTN|nr:hypothetical protein [Streptomyces sparsogenes]OMI35999.1 hypothetical protein SPAR_28426 [Streptomyces sparsogenes DSM 40356]